MLDLEDEVGVQIWDLSFLPGSDLPVMQTILLKQNHSMVYNLQVKRIDNLLWPFRRAKTSHSRERQASRKRTYKKLPLTGCHSGSLEIHIHAQNLRGCIGKIEDITPECS